MFNKSDFDFNLIFLMLTVWLLVFNFINMAFVEEIQKSNYRFNFLKV